MDGLMTLFTMSMMTISMKATKPWGEACSGCASRRLYQRAHPMTMATSNALLMSRAAAFLVSERSSGRTSSPPGEGFDDFALVLALAGDVEALVGALRAVQAGGGEEVPAAVRSPHDDGQGDGDIRIAHRGDVPAVGVGQVLQHDGLRVDLPGLFPVRRPGGKGAGQQQGQQGRDACEYVGMSVHIVFFSSR